MHWASWFVCHFSLNIMQTLWLCVKMLSPEFANMLCFLSYSQTYFLVFIIVLWMCTGCLFVFTRQTNKNENIQGIKSNTQNLVAAVEWRYLHVYTYVRKEKRRRVRENNPKYSNKTFFNYTRSLKSSAFMLCCCRQVSTSVWMYMFVV